MCRERGLKIDRSLGYFLATAAIITLLKSSLVNDTSLIVHCNQHVLKCTNADVFKMSHTSNYELFSDIIHHWSCTTVNRQQKKFVDLNVGCKLSLKLSLSPTRWSKFNIAQLAAIRWRATLAHCFASYYSFLFVLWRISPSLVIYLKCSLQQEKNSKSGPHKAGYWRSGDQASRLQSRKKPCYRDKQLGRSFDLWNRAGRFAVGRCCISKSTPIVVFEIIQRILSSWDSKPIMVKFTADIINLIKDTYGDYLSSLSRNPAPHVGYVYMVTGFRFSGMGAPFSFVFTDREPYAV